MSLRSELEKILSKNVTSKGASKMFVSETPSEVGTVITKEDAIFIAKVFKEEMQTGKLERYQKNSPVFAPPVPSSSSSDAYTTGYISMLKNSKPGNSLEEAKIYLWILLSEEKKDPSLKDLPLQKITMIVENTCKEWESIADKKGMTLTQYVNEECTLV